MQNKTWRADTQVDSKQNLCLYDWLSPKSMQIVDKTSNTSLRLRIQVDSSVKQFSPLHISDDPTSRSSSPAFMRREMNELLEERH
jgi:hypothetical protein